MPIELGNVIGHSDWYKGSAQGIITPTGRIAVSVIAIATITDTLQITLPLNVIAPGKNLILQGKNSPIPLVIPVGAQIDRVDFRLPRALLPQEEYTYGLQLPKNTTIIGTTGENLKVSPTTTTTHAVTIPIITAANNAYASGASAVLSRGAGSGDGSSPSLLTTVSGSPLALGIAVSNAGNTAAGTGIRLSTTGAIAYIYARIIYTIAGNAIDPTLLPFPYAPDTAVGG
jgi:hypothetical protein